MERSIKKKNAGTGIGSVLCFFIASALMMSAAAQDQNNTDAKIKAIFIYNFTKYIEWPSAYKEGSFAIGILGDSPLFQELGNLHEQGKKAGGQPFEISKFSNAVSVKPCHILFVAAEESHQIPSLIKKLRGNSTLIISEKENMAQNGAAINFVYRNNKQKFELNKGELDQRNLKVSSSLLALAILVE